MQTYYWLIIFAVLLVIELATVGLTTIWFAGGALVAFFVSLAGANVYIQVIIFLAVSAVLLITTRPLALRYLTKNKEKTNVENIPGQEAEVIENIDNLKAAGKVMLNGMEWSARAEDLHEKIEKGTVVRVVRVEGVKLIVSRNHENAAGA